MEMLNAGGVLITAIATSIMAVFSIGTYKLYQLERKRDAEQRGRLAARLYRLRTDFLAFAKVLKNVNDDDPDSLGSVIKEMAAGIRARRDVASRLLDSAENATMEVVAYLDVFLLELQEIETLLRVVMDDLVGELEAPLVVDELIQKLEAASTAATHAYLSLPESERGWDGSGQYHEVFELALRAIRGEIVEESALESILRERAES